MKRTKLQGNLRYLSIDQAQGKNKGAFGELLGHDGPGIPLYCSGEREIDQPSDLQAH